MAPAGGGDGGASGHAAVSKLAEAAPISVGEVAAGLSLRLVRSSVRPCDSDHAA